MDPEERQNGRTQSPRTLSAVIELAVCSWSFLSPTNIGIKNKNPQYVFRIEDKNYLSDVHKQIHNVLPSPPIPQ